MTTTDPNLEHVLNSARDELIGLEQKKTELVKRIGTVKQTIAGLADLFGNEVLDDELLEVLDRKGQARQIGLTSECRFALMDSRKKMTTREVVKWILEKNPAKLTHHKDPRASVSTVLNRLVDYGEAQAVVLENGKRAWQWSSELAVEQSRHEHRPTVP